MMNETKEMREARHALQELSASDPSAIANMLRHAAAFSIMVAGRRGRDRRDGEPQIGAGFVLTQREEKLCAATARRSGTDSIYLAFDIDDAAGPRLSTSVFRQQGDDMLVYENCRLWSSANDARALIVPTGDAYVGYLAFRPGERLKLIEAPLPGGFEAGVRRADARMQHLLSSDALRNVHREGFVHRVYNEGHEIFAKTRRAAA